MYNHLNRVFLQLALLSPTHYSALVYKLWTKSKWTVCWVQNMHMTFLFTIKRWIKVVSLFGLKDGFVSECGNVMFSGTSVWIFLHSSGHRWLAKGSDMLQPVTFPQDASQQVWLSLPGLRERNFNVLIIADKEKTRSALKNTDTRQLHLSEQR